MSSIKDKMLFIRTQKIRIRAYSVPVDYAHTINKALPKPAVSHPYLSPHLNPLPQGERKRPDVRGGAGGVKPSGGREHELAKG